MEFAVIISALLITRNSKVARCVGSNDIKYGEFHKNRQIGGITEPVAELESRQKDSYTHNLLIYF
jgi:hypothetical protein